MVLKKSSAIGHLGQKKLNRERGLEFLCPNCQIAYNCTLRPHICLSVKSNTQNSKVLSFGDLLMLLHKFPTIFLATLEVHFTYQRLAGN